MVFIDIRDETGNIWKKEEDNLVRERIDWAGGWCGRGAGPPSHSRDFWDFWYQKQLF